MRTESVETGKEDVDWDLESGGSEIEEVLWREWWKGSY
jgi:hypothetical protein